MWEFCFDKLTKRYIESPTLLVGFFVYYGDYEKQRSYRAYCFMAK